MKNYFELKISINPNIEEIVSDICFSNFDCEGVVLAEEAWKDLEMTSTTRGTLRVFLKDLNNNPLEVLKTERELLKSRGFTDEELGSWEVELDKKENQDWSKKWKEKWTVTHVTDNIAVVPSWLSYEPKENEITITLDPGCAFGTGTHQTTQLCMKAMEKYLNKNDSVADIGTGSGILAICALKMGAKSAYGCDNDETVINVCYENAVKNGLSVNLTPPPNPLPQGAGELDKCSEPNFSLPQEAGEAQYPPHEGGSKSLISGWGNSLTFELNTADKLTEKYDFVCANILHNVLAEIMGDLKNIMKPHAKMVLSGILDEKKAVVLDAIQREGLKIIETIPQDQWVAYVVEN